MVPEDSRAPQQLRRPSLPFGDSVQTSLRRHDALPGLWPTTLTLLIIMCPLPSALPGPAMPCHALPRLALPGLRPPPSSLASCPALFNTNVEPTPYPP